MSTNQNNTMNQQPMMQQQMNQPIQQQMNQPMQQQMNQQMQQPMNQPMQQQNNFVSEHYNYPQIPDNRGGVKNQLKTVGTIKKTSSALIEVSGSVELTPYGPSPIAFFMMVPGQKDQTKKSGRTYLMDQKINMKFDAQDLFALAHCLKTGLPFEKFTDPSKSSHVQGSGSTKKVSTAQANDGFFVNFTYGQQSVGLKLNFIECSGFAGALESLANSLYADSNKYWKEYGLMKADEYKNQPQNVGYNQAMNTNMNTNMNANMDMNNMNNINNMNNMGQGMQQGMMQPQGAPIQQNNMGQ